MESSEEDFPADGIANIFGKSEGEDDFSGINFTHPNNKNWETDEDGSKTHRFNELNPHKVFSISMLVQQSMNYLDGQMNDFKLRRTQSQTNTKLPLNLNNINEPITETAELEPTLVYFLQ